MLKFFILLSGIAPGCSGRISTMFIVPYPGIKENSGNVPKWKYINTKFMNRMLGISAGALINGVRQKNLHIRHHVIRLAAETVITLICWLGK